MEEIQKGKCLASYRLHQGTVYCLDAFWRDGKPGRTKAVPKPWYKGGGFDGQKVTPEMGPEGGPVTLVTGSHDQTIIKWEVLTPEEDSTIESEIVAKEQLRFSGHVGDVYSIEILKGDYAGRIASGGDYTICVWDIKTGQQLQMFEGHTGFVSCIKVVGRKIFSGSWDTTVRSWDMSKGRAMHVFKAHTNIVNCVDVTPSDIFSGGWDTTIVKWNRATGEPSMRFEGHSDGVQCLQVSGKMLFSGSMDKTARMWNIETGKVVKTYRGHNSGVECLEVGPDGIKKVLFTGSYDKTIRCFRVETAECIGLFEGHTDGVYCLKLFNGILYSGSGDKSIRIWDAKPFVLEKQKSGGGCSIM